MASVAAGVLAISTTVAYAGDGTTNVACQQSIDPGCTVAASTSTVHPASNTQAHPQRGATGSGASGPCHDWRGELTPCTDPQLGWLGSDGCYWQVDTGYQPPAWDTADQHQGQPGAWYDITCVGVHGTGGGLAWVPNSPAGPAGPPPPPPAVLARQARNQLQLAGPRIDANPSPQREQLVSLPSWLWVAGWSPVTATAAVPGESVAATATPMRVVWSMGDGATVVCPGAGTPYRAGDDPHAPSPDCGHTYRTSSAGQPDGAYQVTATVTWSIRWSGGGQAGALPALTTTSQVALRVAEAQTVNTTTGE